MPFAHKKKKEREHKRKMTYKDKAPKMYVWITMKRAVRTRDEETDLEPAQIYTNESRFGSQLKTT